MSEEGRRGCFLYILYLDNSILDKVQEGMGEADRIQRRVDDKIHQSRLGILGLTQGSFRLDSNKQQLLCSALATEDPANNTLKYYDLPL